MRLLGIVLVVIGSLILGYQGIGQAGDEPDARSLSASAASRRADVPTPVKTPVVIGGIAITAGLLLVTVGEKDDEKA